MFGRGFDSRHLHEERCIRNDAPFGILWRQEDSFFIISTPFTYLAFLAYYMTLTAGTKNHDTLGKLTILIFGVMFCFKIYTDLSQVDNAYFVDLRNRIVGARLMDRDTLPYFFKWNSSYPETFYDPYDKCNIRNNMTTSPPSVLFLMQPLARLDYTTICTWWIWIHYVFFLLIIIPVYLAFKNPASKGLILVISSLFLLSDHWRDSVFRGQSHFVFPAIMAVCLLIASARIRYSYLLIGLLLASLLWLRPNAILVVPFLFLCKEVKRKQLFTGLGTGLGIFGLLTFLLGHQLYWFEFYQTCREWMRNNTSGLIMSVCNQFQSIEGKTVRFDPGHPRVRWQSEIMDIYHLAKSIFHVSLKTSYLTIFFVVAYVRALAFYFRKRIPLFSTALLAGILLYWLSEMTAPILKMSYYYVELFAVVLFMAGMYDKLLMRERILLASSFIFTFLPFIPMNLSIAELCTVACMGSYLFRSSRDIPAPY